MQISAHIRTVIETLSLLSNIAQTKLTAFTPDQQLEQTMPKTQFFNQLGAQAVKRLPLRQFSPLLVVMVGLPGRGKSHLAKRLSRYMNFTGYVTQG